MHYKSLKSLLVSKNCKDPDDHIVAMMDAGRKLSCYEAGVQLWFMRRRR